MACVHREEDLGVAVGAEREAVAPELLSQLAVVVDLAVVRDPVAPVAVLHGLRAAFRRVDDRQPPMSQGRMRPAAARAEGARALAVRPAVGERLGHRTDELVVG